MTYTEVLVSVFVGGVIAGLILSAFRGMVGRF